MTRTARLSATAAALAALTLAAASATAADLGRRVAEEGTDAVPACLACHGPDGLGDADIGAPMIAGMDEAYLRHALEAYATGTRVGPTMEGIAPGLSADERAAVAAYYAALPAAPKDWEVDAAQATAGKAIATAGNVATGTPACTSCHGTNAEGIGATFPRLAGQLPAYMSARLEAWRDGSDAADTPDEALMASIARQLPAEALDAAVAYMASLAPDSGPSLAYQGVDIDWPVQTYNTAAVPAEIPWTKAQAAHEKQAKRMARPDAYDHTPPSFDSIPEGPEGDLIRFGRYLFSNTQVLRGTFVNNDMSCSNCHMGEGASKTAAPVWATAVDFPQYRSKNKHVNTLAERIAGCFFYSMNGTPPPAQHKVMVALEAYMKWLGKGIPSDAVQKVRGYVTLPLPEKTPNFARGEKVFAERCATCHGAEGQGLKQGQRVVFPPLWGPDSYNWGAGMHQLDKAAAFIKANMPLGNADLSEQEAWDVALFMDSHERPQDPRWKGDVQATRNAHHNHVCTYGLETEQGLMGDIGAPLPKPDPLPWQNWASKWEPAAVK